MSNQANSRTPAAAASNTSTGTPANPDQKHHFDLHATGLGYINRPRTVSVKGKGNDYLAVDISALRGEPGKVEYTHFSCRVSGKEAQRVIRDVLAEPIKAGKPVLVRFKVGDLVPDAFTFKKGPHEGKQGLNIKSHLLFLYWAKVGDECLYRAPDREGAAPQSATAEAAAAPAPAVAQESQTPTKGRVFDTARDVSNHDLSEEEIDAQMAELAEIGF